MKKLKPLRKLSRQHNQSKNRVKALRTNPPLAELRELIELTNLIPDDVPTPQALEAARKQSDWDAHARSMVQILDKLPSKVRQYIGEYPSGDFGLGQDPHSVTVDSSAFGMGALPAIFLRMQAQERYDYLVSGKYLLAAFADSWDGRIHIRLRVHIELKPDGLERAQFVLPSWAEWVPLVDVSRIRRCLACKKIFWANHGNKQTCSSECSNAHRQREYRHRYAENYKLQRIGLNSDGSAKQDTPKKKKGK